MAASTIADLQGRRLLVLGAGHQQVALIRRARERGAFVVTSDRNPGAPGMRWGSAPVVADVLDHGHNIRIARQYGVDGVVTVGTDQALTTVAAVADACGLPCHVTPEGAFKATHKIAMTEALSAAGVRTTRRVVIRPGDDVGRVRALRCPLVVKPADAQGQLGITRVESYSGMEQTVRTARDLSREGAAVVEEFLDGPEVTATAWVEQGEVRLLLVADRVTYNPSPYLGIALRHVFPTFHARHLSDHIGGMLRRVAAAYSITDGPLYVQMIVVSDSVAVVEAAARVGGGHEIALTPCVTGIDLVECSIDLALGHPPSVRFDLRKDKPLRHGLVNFVIAHPGILARHAPFDKLVKAGLIVEGGWYRDDGFEQKPVTDAYGRIGWFLVASPDRDTLLRSANIAYGKLVVEDPDGRNLVYWPEPALLRAT